MSFSLYGAPGQAAKSRGRTSQEMRRTINAALNPPEKIGRHSISARAARVNPTAGRAVPADPTRYPDRAGPLRELARISDARVINTSHGKTMAKITSASRDTGRRAAARPASANPKRAAAPMHARGGSWEAKLLAEVEEAATALRKTRSKARGKDGARVAARQAWAAVEAGTEAEERRARALLRAESEEGGGEEEEEEEDAEEEEEAGEEEEEEEEAEEEGGEEEEVESPARRRPQSDPASPVSPAIEGTATATLWQEPRPAAVAARQAREQKPARRAPKQVAKKAAGARSAVEGGELERRAEGYWGGGGTATLKEEAEREAGGAPVPVPRPIRQLQLLTAAQLGELQAAVRRQRAQD